MSNKDEIIVEINRPVKNNKKSNKKNKKKKIKKVSNIKKVKKQQNKARKLIIKISIISLLIIILAIVLASSEIFNIKEISVSGIDKLTQNEIISFSNVKIDDNIFKINFGKTKSLIKENPYVEEVSIKRKIPNKIEICVKERKVKYMLQLAESYIYVDGQGYILEISKEKRGVPILLGIFTDLSNIETGDRLVKEDLIKLNTVNKIVGTCKNYEIYSLLTKIDMTEESNFVIYFEGEGKLAYIGDATDLNTKVLWIKTILEQNKQVSGKIFVNMDLNIKRPYFRAE